MMAHLFLGNLTIMGLQLRIACINFARNMKSPENNDMTATHETLVDRLRYLIVLSRLSQARFARNIGLDPSNLSKHLSGKLPINDSLINRVVVETGVSRRWLRDGDGVPFSTVPEPASIEFDPARVEDVVGVQAPVLGTPVYDIDVAAGTAELPSLFTRDRIVGMVNLPSVNAGNAIVRVSGDSMTPVIRDGSYVSIRQVNDPSTIFWGGIYVIVMDDYRLVKFVRRHDDESKVILHSANPCYDDMEVNRGDIRSLFYVDVILNVDVRG
jgi:Predicted transcriptional regulator